MGVSGTAIFSDDTACDVRDEYRELVANGSSGPAATKQLLREWQEIIQDEDEGPVFWLALAATQWACGRLEGRVKREALKIIDKGSSLARWAEGGSGMLKQRQAVLSKLRAQIQSPQPAVKKFRKPPKEQAPQWKIGEVVAYRLRSGRLVLLHVVAEFGPSPVLAILDWVGDEIPSKEQIKTLPLIVYRGTTSPCLNAVMSRNKNDLPADRITHLAIQRRLHKRKITGGFGAYFWKDLDAELKARFGKK